MLKCICEPSRCVSEMLDSQMLQSDRIVTGFKQLSTTADVLVILRDSICDGIVISIPWVDHPAPRALLRHPHACSRSSATRKADPQLSGA